MNFKLLVHWLRRKTRTSRRDIIVTDRQVGKNAAWKLGVRQVWNDTNLLYETTTAIKGGMYIQFGYMNCTNTQWNEK